MGLEKIKIKYVMQLKQDLMDKCSSPINPFAAFSLSNSTFIGAFATILTYLIVLIQFKASDDKVTTTTLQEINEKLRVLMKNNSAMT